MDVIRAEVLGFCGGVRRAVAMIEDAVREAGTIYTLHAIVHNQQVMNRLEASGVIQVASISQTPDDASVAITAHGATKPTIAALQIRGLKLIDTTCPIVRDAQRVLSENATSGRFTIIYGDGNHLEVRGLLSHAPGQAMATQSLNALEVPADRTLAVASQTTKSPEALQAFATNLAAHLSEDVDLLVQDTTCHEPVARYQAARALAARVDAMVIVGSRDSANTGNLKRVCQESGTPAYLVESADEIDASLVGQARVLGLTAGASTPDWAIDEVERRLQRL
ncbi:4-hydroxy-3-methylbut-2-enyl diphosphate reductase [Candidatus Bipolaricaulota bacterium]|nr:4-hydroxy-3-methylbut-2-enyl diphosphate reductase [Candidatus Bipolaricaulota bacterium]